MCASAGSMVAPSVARISTECDVRVRKPDARVCVRALGRPRLAALSLPVCPFRQPLSAPCLSIHTCMWVVRAMYR